MQTLRAGNITITIEGTPTRRELRSAVAELVNQYEPTQPEAGVGAQCDWDDITDGCVFYDDCSESVRFLVCLGGQCAWLYDENDADVDDPGYYWWAESGDKRATSARALVVATGCKTIGELKTAIAEFRSRRE